MFPPPFSFDVLRRGLTARKINMTSYPKKTRGRSFHLWQDSTVPFLRPLFFPKPSFFIPPKPKKL